MARVIIVGGGIGGLTTALAFCRKGWEVSVHEATPELAPVGKGIWVPINAMQVLERLGLAKQISDRGWPLQAIELGTVTGAAISTLRLDELALKYGYTITSIRRADLVEALANALPSGVLHLGRRFTHFVQDSAQVCAHFEDGPEERGDLLVGADGIHSRVREQLFPGVRLRYSGQTCFRGIAEIALSEELAGTCREIWGGKNRFGFAAVGPRQVYWFAPQLSPPGVRDPLEARKTMLAQRYSDFPDPIPKILADTRTDEILRTDLFDFSPIPSWCGERVALIGDAAHAMTPNLGQGGAQAIEDAFVLAEQCGQAASLGAALGNYERMRMPKVKWIVNTAWNFGQLAHWQNPLARWVRDAGIRWTPKSVERKQMERICGLDY